MVSKKAGLKIGWKKLRNRVKFLFKMDFIALARYECKMVMLLNKFEILSAHFFFLANTLMNEYNKEESKMIVLSSWDNQYSPF